MNYLRKRKAWDKRHEANQLANERPIVDHISNGDEHKFRKEIDGKDHPIYPASFTKGLPHEKETGLIKKPQHFQYFVKGIDSGDPRDFRDTPLGPDAHCGSAMNCPAPEINVWLSPIALTGDGGDPVKVRAWESQSAGLVYELEGYDAQAVTMPPHPKVGSAELTAEMAEVYAQAILRDIPFNALSAGILDDEFLEDPSLAIPQRGVANKPILRKLLGVAANEAAARDPEVEQLKTDVQTCISVTEQLKGLNWFSGDDIDLTEQEHIRRRRRLYPNPSNAFRGITRGDDVGPYLSQFLLIGNKEINGNDSEQEIASGKIRFGAMTADQKVRVASPDNYMKTWEEWMDVQNGANVSGHENYEANNARRFIYTPRDLATYVHFDALYQAYLNACLILLGRGAAFDPGIPYQENDNRDHQQGFAHFGGPHILTLVTEVATRALKAVRFQKYNVHRRCRPEVLAARITKADQLTDVTKEFQKMRDAIGTNPDSILDRIHNQNGQLSQDNNSVIHNHNNYLLPMAFTEGSPMHPAYGAGHATVAGACVTVLKAFFDCNAKFKPNGNVANKAYVSTNNGSRLELATVFDQLGNKVDLTIEGELNKLASNISIGRNWAGVHYFTDYYESLLMGEKIAIGILEEQKLLFKETFSMSIPLFGGGTIRI